MEKKTLSVLILSTILLSGCTRSLDIFKKEVEREPLAIENPHPPKINNYRIYVITEENAEEVFRELKEAGVDPVLFGLTDRGYETKAVNDKKTVNYIIELRRILDEYRNYYESDS